MIRIGISETKLNSLKMKCIQRLLNPTNAFWKNLMLYQLNLILNLIKNWPFLDKNRSLGQLVINILQKQNNNDFFIQLLNAWLAAFYQ